MPYSFENGRQVAVASSGGNSIQQILLDSANAFHLCFVRKEQWLEHRKWDLGWLSAQQWDLRNGAAVEGDPELRGSQN